MEFARQIGWFSQDGAGGKSQVSCARACQLLLASSAWEATSGSGSAKLPSRERRPHESEIEFRMVSPESRSFLPKGERSATEISNNNNNTDDSREKETLESRGRSRSIIVRPDRRQWFKPNSSAPFSSGSWN